MAMPASHKRRASVSGKTLAGQAIRGSFWIAWRCRQGQERTSFDIYPYFILNISILFSIPDDRYAQSQHPTVFKYDIACFMQTWYTELEKSND
jgi:hypothetical protein